MRINMVHPNMPFNAVARTVHFHKADELLHDRSYMLPDLILSLGQHDYSLCLPHSYKL